MAADARTRLTGDVATVCLDVGEVLVDETRVWTVWAQLLGVSAFTLHATIGAALAAGRTHLDALAAVGGSDWGALADEHERRYGGFQESDLYPDVRPALRTLRAHGLRVVIAGNQPLQRSAQLRALGLPADDVVTSAELGVEKPDPRFFAALAARTDQAPERLLYVGDRRDNDVGPAAGAGWATAWIRRGPWARLQPGPDVAADLVVDDLDALVAALC